MTTSTPSTISLTQPNRTKEGLANAALSPGHLVELMSTGKYRKNTQASVLVPRAFALEKEYDGKEITVAYAADDQVVVGLFESGAEVVARLAAGATAVVIGDRLEAAADGTVRKLSTADTLVLTGAVTDDDSAASNGTAVYVHLDELGEGPLAHLESVTAGNADTYFDVGTNGSRVRVEDDDAAATGGLQVYFDEDAASADSRFLINNTVTGKDVFVVGSDGRAIRFKHDASASSNGVALYIDDNGATVAERLLFVSPTNADGSYTTDDEVGFYTNVNAVQAIAIALEAVNNSGGSSEEFVRIQLL